LIKGKKIFAIVARIEKKKFVHSHNFAAGAKKKE
jgi:hypothetical protein